ncbi:hypothetical protein [Acinetobacter equi]|uniref:Uncharacterized protein n=1 Tax=Acinetobacter equi TaxID=1324350 RepID=A0A0N9VZN2_9GAMM|nr:hypothetical protein [Acinetobacter equi]ALH95677.1 hypothetical protein AOY20_09115 [Acinetobacter equi]
MTLTIAINLDDYVILTGDQRLTIECEPFTNLPAKTIIDNYKKIKQWTHGGITVSGDVLLMQYFHEELEAHARHKTPKWDFLNTARLARVLYLQDDKPIDHATGCAFFSLFNLDKVELIHLSIRKTVIEYETVLPMHAHFSLFAGTPDDPIYQQFVDALKKVNTFKNFIDFFNYHVDLIKAFYKRQQSFDESITSTFDLYIQDTKTGLGFMQTIENP